MLSTRDHEYSSLQHLQYNVTSHHIGRSFGLWCTISKLWSWTIKVIIFPMSWGKKRRQQACHKLLSCLFPAQGKQRFGHLPPTLRLSLCFCGLRWCYTVRDALRMWCPSKCELKSSHHSFSVPSLSPTHRTECNVRRDETREFLWLNGTPRLSVYRVPSC